MVKVCLFSFKLLFTNLFYKLQIDPFHPTTSAPVVKHPTLLDEPVYKVQVIQPASKPLQNNHTASALATLFASDTHTSLRTLAAERIICFVLEVASIFIKSLIRTGVDAHIINEIVYVSGTSCSPGLDDSICLNWGFKEEIEAPIQYGTVLGGCIGDPTIFALECAFRAALILSFSARDTEAFSRKTKMNEVKPTTCTLGVLFPNNLQEGKEVTGRNLNTGYSERNGPPFS